MAVLGVSQVNNEDFYKQINTPQTSASQKVEAETPIEQPKVEKKLTTGQKFDSFIDKFSTSVKNSADLNDTVTVPRTIFKGYFSFMIGTTLLTIGAFSKNNIVKKIFNIPGGLIALLGTYFFVRPYLIKSKQPEQKPESEQEATGLKS